MDTRHYLEDVTLLTVLCNNMWAVPSTSQILMLPGLQLMNFSRLLMTSSRVPITTGDCYYYYVFDVVTQMPRVLHLRVS